MIDPLLGINVMQCPGGSWCANRRHAKRKNGGKVSYHARISKKWLKRFGQSWIESQKRGEIFILGQHTIIVRHDDMPRLRELLCNA